jgi:gas vesicle structural protein
MTVAVQSANRAPRPSGLADVLELVLDRGVVIDAYVRVAVIGIELVTIDARIVIASVDTYLRFAEAVNRLDLQPHEPSAGLPGLVDQLREGGAERKTKGALSGVKESAKEVLSSARGGGDDESESGGRRRAPAGRSAPRSRRPARRTRDEDEG